LVGGLAARSAIAKCTGLQPTLKWPNDVFLNNKKVAGILGDSAMEEDQVKYVVIGVGINANLDKKQLEKIVRLGKIHTATSLSEHLNRPVDIICLAAELLNSLEFYYESLLRDGSRAVLEEWKKHASILNRNISILYEGKQRIIGKAVDVSEYGDLIIETARGSSLSISASSARVIQEKDRS
jgi:BirA family biotin operon repressor/biotin-[acetyl-CoA-carboxylase] ligase